MHGLLAAAILLIGAMNFPNDSPASAPRAGGKDAASPAPAAKRLQTEIWHALHTSGGETDSLPRAPRRFRR